MRIISFIEDEKVIKWQGMYDDVVEDLAELGLEIAR